MTSISKESGRGGGTPAAAIKVAAKLSPIAIVGPTAAGKSDVAVAVAAHLAAAGVAVEVVACDSVQVYRGFDRGSGKPSPAQRAAVPHHLLDCADWHTPYDAARWRHDAQAALAEVARRGALGLICGGTGLYLRALCRGLVPLPQVAPAERQALRAALRQRAVQEPAWLHAELQRRDPEAAAALHPHSTAHLLSALELCMLAGQPASQLRAQQRAECAPLDVPTFYLGWPAPALRQRIVRRSAAMLDAGLLDEVADLLRRGVDPACRPMQSVGYRECVDCLAGRLTRAALAERIAVRTWAYARRQRTWWRRDGAAQQVDAQDVPAAVQAICAALAPGTG